MAQGIRLSLCPVCYASPRMSAPNSTGKLGDASRGEDDLISYSRKAYSEKKDKQLNVGGVVEHSGNGGTV